MGAVGLFWREGLFTAKLTRNVSLICIRELASKMGVSMRAAGGQSCKKYEINPHPFPEDQLKQREGDE